MMMMMMSTTKFTGRFKNRHNFAQKVKADYQYKTNASSSIKSLTFH